MGERRTVLLVDDDAVTREVLHLRLAHAGWTVTEADSGEAALECLRDADETPGLIVADLRMPGICGPALASALRQSLEGVAGETVLLAMTATPTPEGVSGYVGLLLKPFDADDLERAWDSASQGQQGAGGQALHPLSGSGVVTDTSAIDLVIWKQLQRSMGDASARALYAMVLADAEKRAALMQAAMDKGEDTVYRSEAHALKGSCSMVGVQRLRDAAASAEVGGLEGHAKGKYLLAQIFVELYSFRLMLKKLLTA